MEEKQTTKQRRKYDSAFKEEVLKMVMNGRPVAEVAQALGVGENLIYYWKKRYIKALDSKGMDNNEERAVLNKRIRDLEMERDILKKALGIFSRQN
jgi:transposase